MGFLRSMQISYYLIPSFVIIIFIFALFKKCDAYDSFIEGAKEGVGTSITILPFLLSMYVAVSVLDASGLIQDIVRLKSIPIELILQGAFRPVSSNASMSFMLKAFEIYGVDSPAGIASSVMQGGCDTTLYVMTLYFGSIGVVNYRYALKVGLSTDILCFILCVCLYFSLQ